VRYRLFPQGDERSSKFTSAQRLGYWPQIAMFLEPTGQSTVTAGPEFSLRKPSMSFQRGQTPATPQEIHQSPTEPGIVKQAVNVSAGHSAILADCPIVY